MADVFAKNEATSAADAAKIVPRAEFRVFGQGVIDIVKERMWNGKTVLFQARRMPAETYFLSANTDEANVKVRDGLLDIKVTRLLRDVAGIGGLDLQRLHPRPQPWQPDQQIQPVGDQSCRSVRSDPHPVAPQGQPAARSGQLHHRQFRRDGAQAP